MDIYRRYGLRRIGFVDASWEVYATGIRGCRRIGRVDRNGEIYRGERPVESIVGNADRRGYICGAGVSRRGHGVGEVDRYGRVFTRGEHGRVLIGQVRPEPLGFDRRAPAAGAAFLLLFRVRHD
ncbi:hypothetical protein CcI49_18590 [Frankia sp. CcI49]|uniref:hypothetical protein n=1 Tax=unclassified Frankia TaxID=2632575 RepID=UPI0006CA0684|nr:MULTISPECIES: hypothetical protein [unclassified Frankia]KPM51796.1 hypothetical protein ACG83_33895 [Frankia sp. R43]ONH59150.1 hypothetical protein CcI49_18590 [Frankia sp. CcI49]